MPPCGFFAFPFWFTSLLFLSFSNDRSSSMLIWFMLNFSISFFSIFCRRISIVSAFFRKPTDWNDIIFCFMIFCASLIADCTANEYIFCLSSVSKFLFSLFSSILSSLKVLTSPLFFFSFFTFSFFFCFDMLYKFFNCLFISLFKNFFSSSIISAIW